MADPDISLPLDLPFHLDDEKAIAVAVSGGPDSMALVWLMWRWARAHDMDLHVISVDHCLRPESADEVAQVGSVVAQWDGATHHALKYEGEPFESAVQEEARVMRYDLMAQQCKELGVRYLCFAHHMDDQGETFLFRLAKGSGLDGLCAMRSVQHYSDDLILLRPLLDVPKSDLIELCKDQGLPYALDPSNEKAIYARARLRQARDVLEAEGLTNKRLAITAKRLQRGQEALESLASLVFEDYADETAKGMKLSLKARERWPEEIVFRAFLRVVKSLRPKARYNPRMERLEDLFDDAYKESPFRKRTLGGLVFELKDRILYIYPE